MERQETVSRLREVTRRLRVDIVEMLAAAGSGHPGGSLSAVDLIATLYLAEMRWALDDPDRDRFVLSKGHGVPALYAVLAEVGVLPRTELSSLRQLGSRLQGHPVNHATPGIEASTGSLGQGLSVAQGIALANRLDGRAGRVYCLIGDGETQEGQIWEAALSGAKWRLDNLCVMLDFNQGQIDGYVQDVMPLEPLADKWRAFGWQVLEIDGHDFDAILDALAAARAARGRPTLILAHTVKGKGVSFMEDRAEWHGVAPTREQAAAAVAEILGRP